MNKIIRPDFFKKHDAVELAPWLLGKNLVRVRNDGGASRHLITETEAYNGVEDLACHASKGRTARTEILYQAGGCWYVYLCYGIHEMLNLVVGPEGFPAAVLIRGLQDVSGPGRLTKRLAIGRSLNGKAAIPENGLYLEEAGVAVPPKWIQISARIGVEYAGVWADKAWRFSLDPRWPGWERVKRAVG